MFHQVEGSIIVFEGLLSLCLKQEITIACTIGISKVFRGQLGSYQTISFRGFLLLRQTHRRKRKCHHKDDYRKKPNKRFTIFPYTPHHSNVISHLYVRSLQYHVPSHQAPQQEENSPVRDGLSPSGLCAHHHAR